MIWCWTKPPIWIPEIFEYTCFCMNLKSSHISWYPNGAVYSFTTCYKGWRERLCISKNARDRNVKALKGGPQRAPTKKKRNQRSFPSNIPGRRRCRRLLSPNHPVEHPPPRSWAPPPRWHWIAACAVSRRRSRPPAGPMISPSPPPTATATATASSPPSPAAPATPRKLPPKSFLLAPILPGPQLSTKLLGGFRQRGKDCQEAPAVQGADDPGRDDGLGGVQDDGGEAGRRRAAHRRQRPALRHLDGQGIVCSFSRISLQFLVLDWGIMIGWQLVWSLKGRTFLDYLNVIA